jgi:molybdenum cofactor cytidylyltransferase
MAASLRTGVGALGADTAGAFVFLGDMPRVPAAVLAPLAQAIADGRAAAAPVFEGRRGHPAIFARRLFPDLLTLTGDAGARRVLDAADPLLLEAPDEGVLFDVDRPVDLPE